MEQRPLRLGDLVDDYCPRERRLTNHAVVAIVGTSIKQTRCSTCEAEHPYKEGKVPRRKKKDPNGELYEQVLAGVTGQLVSPGAAEHAESAVAVVEAEVVVPAPIDTETVVTATIVVDAQKPVERSAPPASPETPVNGASEEYWPAHRRLIRAQLPRQEGQQPAPRPIHEFTMRQQHGRGNQAFRGGQGWNDRGGQGGDNRGNARGGFRPGKFGGGGGGRPGGGGGRPNNSGGGRSRRSR